MPFNYFLSNVKLSNFNDGFLGTPPSQNKNIPDHSKTEKE